MKKRTLAKALAFAVLVVASVPLVAYRFPETVGSDQAYVVLSGSMVPIFDPGDIIYAEKVDAADLVVGDIITFQSAPGSDRLYTHRIIDVHETGKARFFVTMGDANDDPDPNPVHEELVLARYQWHAPAYGRFVAFMGSKAGFFALVLIPGFLIILQQMRIMWRTIKDMDAKARAERLAKEAAASGDAKTVTFGVVDAAASTGGGARRVR